MIRFQTVTMLATLSWWFVIQLFALAALPLGWRLFARLPGRGYPLAKALGLLLVSYVLWMGATSDCCPTPSAGRSRRADRRGGRIGGWGATVCAAAMRTGARPLAAWLRPTAGSDSDDRALFASFVLVGVGGVPSLQPRDRRHREADGVRLHQRHAPQPLLPAAGSLAVRLRHQLLLLRLRHAGALVQLTGVDPAVGFNLGVALWYALVMIGAFGVVYELVTSWTTGRPDDGSWKQTTGS